MYLCNRVYSVWPTHSEERFYSSFHHLNTHTNILIQLNHKAIFLAFWWKTIYFNDFSDLQVLQNVGWLQQTYRHFLVHHRFPPQQHRTSPQQPSVPRIALHLPIPMVKNHYFKNHTESEKHIYLGRTWCQLLQDINTFYLTKGRVCKLCVSISLLSVPTLFFIKNFHFQYVT